MRYFLLFLIITFLSCNQTGRENNQQDNILHTSCAYLWSMQGSDGGWHSETHGILKGGESLTPFILYALLGVPEKVYKRDEQKIRHGLQFIRSAVNAHIPPGDDAVILDYPNYSAAYALMTFREYGDASDSLIVEKLKDYLINQQFTEGRGITQDHPAYGGWGFGENALQPGVVGHVDISHTRRVLQALSLLLPEEHQVFHKARIYLSRVQNFNPSIDENEKPYLDGGFFTSIVTPETNKSNRVNDDSTRWESYATATADGLLALLYSGLDTTDQRVQAAADWLLDHRIMDYPEGIPHDDPGQWHKVMKYYHLCVRAEAHKALNKAGDLERSVLEILLAKQNPDGSFINPYGGPNKEDDPLLATALAIIALNSLQSR